MLGNSNQFIRRNDITDGLWKAHQALQEKKLQIRLINGEPGTGKTALVNMFINELNEKPGKTLLATGFCNLPSEYNTPYKPFKEILKQLFDTLKEIEKAEKKSGKEKVKSALAFSAQVLLNYAPDLIGSLLPGADLLKDISQHILEESNLMERLKSKTEEPPKQLSESKIIEEFIEFIKALSAEYDIVLFIDDLQWLDAPSTNLLYQMLIELKNSALLFVGCYRSTDVYSSLSDKHPLESLLNEIKISYGNVFVQLDNLDNDTRKAFMNEILDGEPNEYDDAFRDELFRRTQGNPLFVTELINLFQENGELYMTDHDTWINKPKLDWQSYPIRVEGIIRERIGKLEDSLIEVLSHASVQGTRFIVQVLSRTMGEPERMLLMDLSKKLQKQHHLVKEGECVRVKKNLISKFYFSNYIFQQYLYQELSQTQRMLLHGDIAAILEDMYADSIEEVATDIAYHFEMAGEYEQAVKYMEIAANSMMRLSAYNEAIVILEKALQYIREEAPEDNGMTHMRLLAGLCTCYYSVKGWGAAETEDIYRQLEKMREQTGCRDYDEMIAFGLWTIHFVRMDFHKALAILADFQDEAQPTNNMASWQTVCVSLANTYFWMGDFNMANYYLSQLHETVEEHPMSLQNRALYSLLYTNVQLQLGNSEEAIHERNLMQREFTTVPDKFIQAMAWQVVAWHAFFNKETALCHEAATKMLAISERYSFSYYIGLGKIFVAGSLPPAECRKALRLADEGYLSLLQGKDTDCVVVHSLYKYIKASILFHSGMYDECLEILERAIYDCLDKMEMCYVPELHLLRGDCYRTTGEDKKAAVEYLNAANIAERLNSIPAWNKAKELLTL